LRECFHVPLLLCCVWILTSTESAVASSKTKSALKYDRIEVLERFLKAVYPDLANQLAMFELDTTFEGTRGVNIRNLKFYPCRPATNVSVPTIGGVIPQGPQPPAPPIPPRCGDDPAPEFQHFLDVSLGLTPGQGTRPIFRFAASGSYVDTKLKEVREQFAGKPYPTDDQATQALLSKNPKYGPNDKKELLASLPLDRIRTVTGCRLRPETATFIVELEENPQHLLPDLQWHIFGTSPATKTLTGSDCSAVFEPFEGRLTLFTD
jgi:hypothetical protein